MRARDSRLADRLMFVVSVTTNLSQRIAGRLVQLPAPVTFILSQLASRCRLTRPCPGCQNCGMLSEMRSPFPLTHGALDRKSTRLNSSHLGISYAVFCL